VAGLHDAGDSTLANVLGQFVDLMVPIYLNRLARGVDKDFAVMTVAQVRLDLLEETRLDLTIEIIGHLG
jgi:hypothetical protein